MGVTGVKTKSCMWNPSHLSPWGFSCWLQWEQGLTLHLLFYQTVTRLLKTVSSLLQEGRLSVAHGDAGMRDCVQWKKKKKGPVPHTVRQISSIVGTVITLKNILGKIQKWFLLKLTVKLVTYCSQSWAGHTASAMLLISMISLHSGQLPAYLRMPCITFLMSVPRRSICLAFSWQQCIKQFSVIKKAFY